jgi:outer membrane protein assembly factor BamD
MTNRLKFTNYLVIILILSFYACGGPAGDDGPEIGDRALYQAGLKYIEDKEYAAAIKVFNTFESNFPNSVFYKKVRLKRADTMFARNLRSSLIVAVAEYKAYVTLFPTSSDLDYVQMQIALTFFKRKRDYKNDQTETKKAIEEFDLFFRKYPKSKHTDEARKKYNEVKEHLAKHEGYVGDFYLQVDKPYAAERRYRKALKISVDHEARFSFYDKLLKALIKQNKDKEISETVLIIEEENTKYGKRSAEYSRIKELLKNYKPGKQKPKEEKKPKKE